MIYEFDIKNIICKYLFDLKDIINLYNLNRDHQDNIIITNLCDIPDIFLNKVQVALGQKKFNNVERLNVSYNNKITNINHMHRVQTFGMKETLKELCCSGDCSIDQDIIGQLKLVKLYAYGNDKIKNVNHMKETLEELDCGGNCGIDQGGISELKLFKLNSVKNNKIHNVL